MVPPRTTNNFLQPVFLFFFSLFFNFFPLGIKTKNTKLMQVVVVVVVVVVVAPTFFGF